MVANLIPDSIKHEFRVNQDGKAFVSIRGAARLLGISAMALVKSFKQGVNFSHAKTAEELTQQGLDGVNFSCEKQAKQTLAQELVAMEFDPSEFAQWGIPDTAFSYIAHYYAYEGNKKTEEAKAICLAFAAIGVRSWIQSELGWQPQATQNPDLLLTESILDKKLKTMELQNTMLILHGREVVLALNGLQDQIVREETVVIEVLEPNKGSTRFLSAAETLKQIKQRTGQSPKSLTQVIKQLKALGRDDLVVAVKRPVVGEYIIPEKLDEVLNLLFEKTRQGLLGEN